MFGLVLVNDGQNEGPLNNGSDMYCSACSPLVWNNLGLYKSQDIRHFLLGIFCSFSSAFLRQGIDELHKDCLGSRRGKSRILAVAQVDRPCHAITVVF